MNQPQNPIPPRGVRPQLFSAPANKKPHSNARGHADFGPSILATIDGGQSRIASARDRSALKRTLVMAALALLVAAAYVAVKFNGSRAAAAPQVVVAAAPVVMPVAVKAVEPAASAAAPQAVAQGAAAIETVASPVLPASAPDPSANVTASDNSIQQMLNRSEPAPTKIVEKAVGKSARPTRVATAAPSGTAKHSIKSAAPQADTDAELLAAMLPHLKRSTGAPISPAFEKRCGQLADDAAASCRAKFCNGRQGLDAACPVVGVPVRQ